MIETLDLRVTKEAADFLKPGEASTILPGLYGVKLNGKDPRLSAMTDAEQKAWARAGVGFVFGWNIKRRYTKEEVCGAKLFRLIPKSGFRPVGQECGTVHQCVGDRSIAKHLTITRASVNVEE